MNRLRSRIVGTGSYLPAKVLTNHDLERMVETNDEWIVSRTGIRERRIAADHEATSDLSFHAAQRALEAAGLRARDLDLIVVATLTPDAQLPATAVYLQHRLGAKKAAAFDVAAACTGFIYGLAVVDGLIRTGVAKNCLLVGAEVLSRFLNWKDRGTCIIFGDGAGAAVLVPTHGRAGLLSTHLYADGGQADLLCIPGGGSRIPASHEGLEHGLQYVHMKGNETFKLAVKGMTEAATAALEANGVTAADIALLVPHQANIRIIEATAQRLHLPMSKVYVNIERYGNTSGATVPIALDEAVREGRAAAGDLVLLDAFGAGFTWGSALIRW
jgi:3-oxoacyl-[acyl-carrier-protein] synthase-3